MYKIYEIIQSLFNKLKQWTKIKKNTLKDYVLRRLLIMEKETFLITLTSISVPSVEAYYGTFEYV